MNISEEALLLRCDQEGVVTLTLNRPAQFNALSTEMLSALQAELDKVGADGTARVVVIAGAGRAFCAGTTSSRCARTTTRPTCRRCSGNAGGS